MAQPVTKSSIIRTAEHVVASSGVYSVEALYFLQEGMQRATQRVHGGRTRRPGLQDLHVSGQQLCEGLREIAVERWGLMASAVLAKWGVTRTIDFGNIVYALIDAGIYQKTPHDRLSDFADVYDFQAAFVTGYRFALPECVG